MTFSYNKRLPTEGKLTHSMGGVCCIYINLDQCFTQFFCMSSTCKTILAGVDLYNMYIRLLANSNLQLNKILTSYISGIIRRILLQLLN